MDIGSIFLILALLLLVGIFVARPLFEHKSIAVSHEEHELSALMAERDRIVSALQELDFDSTMGKVPPEEYPAQRSALMTRGADVLRQIDTLAIGQALPSSNAAASSNGHKAPVEDRLEAAIAARRATLTGSAYAEQPAAHADDSIEAQIAARRRARQDKSGGFCPKCGKPVQQSDRFCPKCGHALSRNVKQMSK